MTNANMHDWRSRGYGITGVMDECQRCGLKRMQAYDGTPRYDTPDGRMLRRCPKCTPLEEKEEAAQK